MSLIRLGFCFDRKGQLGELSLISWGFALIERGSFVSLAVREAFSVVELF